MTAYYDRETGRKYFVSQGIGGGPGRPWFTLYENGTGSTHRLVTKALPLRDTREEAQADLDAYARKKGWKEVQA